MHNPGDKRVDEAGAGDSAGDRGTRHTSTVEVPLIYRVHLVLRGVTSLLLTILSTHAFPCLRIRIDPVTDTTKTTPPPEKNVDVHIIRIHW